MRAILVFALLTLLNACAPVVQRIPVSTEVAGINYGTTSRDFEAICQQMAQSIISTPAIRFAERTPTIAFLKVDNRSSEYIDTEGMLEKIRFLLMKYGEGKITFLDRKHVEEILKERARKRGGNFSGELKGKIYGVSYFLTGSITSIDKSAGKNKSQYMRYSFRLTDAETDSIVWEDEFEFKKVYSRSTWK